MLLFQPLMCACVYNTLKRIKIMQQYCYLILLNNLIRRILKLKKYHFRWKPNIRFWIYSAMCCVAAHTIYILLSCATLVRNKFDYDLCWHVLIWMSKNFPNISFFLTKHSNLCCMCSLNEVRKIFWQKTKQIKKKKKITKFEFV